MSPATPYSEITDRELRRVLNDSGGYPIVLTFIADWSGESVLLETTIERVLDNFPNTYFYKIDLDRFPDLATRLGVSYAPTTLVNADGEWVDVIPGLLNRSKLVNRLSDYCS